MKHCGKKEDVVMKADMQVAEACKNCPGQPQAITTTAAEAVYMGRLGLAEGQRENCSEQGEKRGKAPWRCAWPGGSSVSREDKRVGTSNATGLRLIEGVSPRSTSHSTHHGSHTGITGGA